MKKYRNLKKNIKNIVKKEVPLFEAGILKLSGTPKPCSRGTLSQGECKLAAVSSRLRSIS